MGCVGVGCGRGRSALAGPVDRGLLQEAAELLLHAGQQGALDAGAVAEGGFPAGDAGEVVEEAEATKSTIDALMGTKPELRFRFIQENAEFADQLDI